MADLKRCAQSIEKTTHLMITELKAINADKKDVSFLEDRYLAAVGKLVTYSNELTKDTLDAEIDDIQKMLNTIIGSFRDHIIPIAQNNNIMDKIAPQIAHLPVSIVKLIKDLVYYVQIGMKDVIKEKEALEYNYLDKNDAKSVYSSRFEGNKHFTESFIDAMGGSLSTIITNIGRIITFRSNAVNNAIDDASKNINNLTNAMKASFGNNPDDPITGKMIVSFFTSDALAASITGVLVGIVAFKKIKGLLRAVIDKIRNMLD